MVGTVVTLIYTKTVHLLEIIQPQVASAAGAYDSSLFQIGTAVSCPIAGCTDSTAMNYDPAANIDDGHVNIVMITCSHLRCLIHSVTDGMVTTSQLLL